MTATSSQEEQRRRASDDRARASFGPFDPMSTISELQAQGIRTASEIARRLTDMLDSAMSPPHPDTPNANGNGDGNGRARVGDLRGAVGRIIDLYGDVLQRTFDAYADLLEERARAGPHLDGGATGVVRVEITPDGGAHSGTGELWLGNDTDLPAGGLRLVPTALVSADGRIPAASVVLDPPVVESLAPGAAICVAVSVEVDPSVLPGYYHGYVLVPELPGEALPLTLLVRSTPGEEMAS
jgi:hypothetical protein